MPFEPEVRQKGTVKPALLQTNYHPTITGKVFGRMILMTRAIAGRLAFLAGFVACSLTLSSCGSGSSASNIEDAYAEAEELAQQTKTVEEQAEKVAQLASELESKLSDLESSVGRFNYEDWKDVVPYIRTEVSDVQNLAADLKREADNTKDEAERADEKAGTHVASHE